MSNICFSNLTVETTIDSQIGTGTTFNTAESGGYPNSTASAEHKVSTSGNSLD